MGDYLRVRGEVRGPEQGPEGEAGWRNGEGTAGSDFVGESARKANGQQENGDDIGMDYTSLEYFSVTERQVSHRALWTP